MSPKETLLAQSTFLAQSMAALKELNRQHVDPAKPALPVVQAQVPTWDPARWDTYLASPAGKAMIERLRSPDLAYKPLFVLEGQESQQVANAFKALSVPLAQHTRPAPAKAPRKPRQPAPLPKVEHVETEQVQYAYTVEPLTGRPRTGAPQSTQPIPLFVQFNLDHEHRAAGRPAAHTHNLQQGFTPRENVAIGAGFGAVTGMGLAHILNAVRHSAPDPISAALFAVAGAAAGLGLGGLLGAKLITTKDVTSVATKMVAGKA